MTNLFTFSKDLDLWKNVARSFSDIYAVANDSDLLEWHVTISKFDNNKEYKFHFFILWHSGFPKIQPKISLLFSQRCMIESPNLFGNWVLLDNNLSLFSITAVLLNLRNVVRRINTNFIDVNKFNSQKCIYCQYPEKQEELNNNNNDDKLMKKDNQNTIIQNEDNNNNVLSVSNLSVASLTISNCTDHSVDVDTGITQLNKEIENDEIILNNNIGKEKISDEIKPEKIIIKKQRKEQDTPKPEMELNITIVEKPNNSTITEKTKDKVVSKINKKNESPKIEKVIKIEKEAVRYLEINDKGEFEWKWTEGKRPNEGLY